MKQITRVASGVLGFLFLVIAIYFGVTGSWVNAILFFFVFGGFEFAAWAFVDPDDVKRDRDK